MHGTDGETQLDEAKSVLRRRMRERLAAVEPGERTTASGEACRRLTALPAYHAARTVMLYLPLPSEVDVLPAAVDAFRRGRTVCVPRVDWDRRDMAPVAVRSFDDAVVAPSDRPVRSPVDGRPVLPENVDIVVVPGLAFDPEGRRLGRGGGYYDRFLARLRRGASIVGIAFDRQVVDAVPVAAHDIAVDRVVTERRVIEPRPGGPRR